MTNKELIARLSVCPPDQEVMILDGENGGGAPRTINTGPMEDVICKADADDCGDCEGLVGKRVILIGYGCY